MTRIHNEHTVELPTLAPEARLRSAVAFSQPRLKVMKAREVSEPRAPGKWSRKEILGHLIDSASNNHGRFVRAQHSEGLIFPPYDQEAWVEGQQYSDARWSSLVKLWAEFNLQIARVMEATPPLTRLRKRTPHNLHEIAFRPVPENESATLEYFMHDYVHHVEHHLDQIFRG